MAGSDSDVQSNTKTDHSGKRKRDVSSAKSSAKSVEQLIGLADPREPHPGDIDQPQDHNFNIECLGENKEGEIFDSFDVEGETRRRGGAICGSVLLMKHTKPLPMWFDKFLCPRVMHGKWCGYVAYAFRRRIKFGTWRNWRQVPKAVKDEAWEDILASWDFRTLLSDKDRAKLKKQWTTYAAGRERNWRTTVWNRFVFKIDPKRPDPGLPWDTYKWMDPAEWELFVAYRSTDETFIALSKKNSENGAMKKFKHHAGSGGYRRYYIRLAKEMREEAILEKMELGLTREEAVQEVSSMVFVIDRSIIFLEANKVNGKYTSDFVRGVADKILEMNKLKQKGELIIEGKDDILFLATEIRDPPGRYLFCPTTAKMEFAFPEHAQEKANKRRAARTKIQLTEEEEEQIEMEKFQKYSDFLSEKLGVEITAELSPEQFLKDLREKKAAAAKVNAESGKGSTSDPPHPDMKDNTTTPVSANKTTSPVSAKRTTSPVTAKSQTCEIKSSSFGTDTGGLEAELKVPIPCYLQIKNSAGIIVTAAAGVVIPSFTAESGCEDVRVKSPVFLPDEPLPIPHQEYSCVGSAAGGVAVSWPEIYIDYAMVETVEAEIPEQRKPELDKPAPKLQKPKQESPVKSDTVVWCKDAAANSSPPRDDMEVDEPGQSSDPKATLEDTEVKREPSPIPDEELLWDFGHHIRVREVRAKVAKAIQELHAHDPDRICYKIPLQHPVFGSSGRQLCLLMESAIPWIKNVDRFKKEWIHGWQIDMWACMLFNKMLARDMSRVQIISTTAGGASSTTTPAEKSRILLSLQKTMKPNKSRLYVMPLSKGLHWMLFIISPEDRTVYCIDPQSNGISEDKHPFQYDLFMSMGAKYDKDRAKPGCNTPPKEWSIVNIMHKTQASTWECGYYVMLYMEKIVLLTAGVDVLRVFPEDRTPYPKPVIDGMIDSFCMYLSESILPACALQNSMRRRGN